LEWGRRRGSGYSGPDFKVEPEDEKEYGGILKRIDQVPRLSDEQVKAAKVTAYFFFCVMEGARFYLCPYFTDKEISEWDRKLRERLWREAGVRFHDIEHLERLRRQVSELEDFVRDPSWTQYVDLRQFPFLGERERAAELVSQAVEGSAGRGYGQRATRLSSEAGRTRG
jgi:hypothetical protein